MEDLVPSRIINVRSENSRLTHGEEMKSLQHLPAEWRDGDCVIVTFANGKYTHLFHEAGMGPKAFSYQRSSAENYTVTLDATQATADNYGALTATFDDALLYIQIRADEAGR